MIATYTVHQVRLDGSLYSKQYLNDQNEMRDWVDSSLGKYARIRIANDMTGEVREFTDKGGDWELVA
jgi:hypothetical protein